MPSGESSHPGCSEYVWQRGVEGVLGQVTSYHSLWQEVIYIWKLKSEYFGRYIFLTPNNFANGPHFVALTQLQYMKAWQNISSKTGNIAEK